MSTRIHLVPNSGGGKYALCSAKVLGSAARVTGRKEFNSLPQEQRCKRCDTIINGPTRIEIRK